MVSDVNLIPRKTLNMMGQPKLIWSPIQLRLANHDNIVLVGRLIVVNVNIDGVHIIEDFEVIEIVDGITPYPTLLGLDWAFYYQTIIDIKKRQMLFEVEDLKITTLLDPIEGRIFVKPTKGK